MGYVKFKVTGGSEDTGVAKFDQGIQFGDLTTITSASNLATNTYVDNAISAISTIVNINNQSGTSYTLVASDAGKLVTASNSNAITVTIPPSIYTNGQLIYVQAAGAGAVTFAAGSGVNITSTGATPASPKLRAQYSAASVICLGSNNFTVIGDIV